MQVFKTFFKVMKKFYPGIILYFGIMMILMLVYANTSDGSEQKFTQSTYSIHIVDEDESELSGYLQEYLGSIHTIMDGDFSEEEWIDMLHYSEIATIITIPEGFGESFQKSEIIKVSSLKDDGQPWGIYVENQMEAYLTSLRAYLSAGYSIEDADSLTKEGLDTEALISMTEKTGTVSRVYALFRFLPYIILSVILSGILPVVLAFNRAEVKARMDVSYMPNMKRNLLLIFSALCASLVLWLITIAAACTVPGAFTEKGLLFILNSFVFAVVSVCVLAFCSSFRLTDNAVSWLCNILGLSFAFLGGTFVPLDYMGKGVQAIGRFLPTYWYSVAIDRINSGEGLSKIIDCLAIELLFGFVLLAIGLLINKTNVRKRSV